MLIPSTKNLNNNQHWQGIKGLGLAIAINEFHQNHSGLIVVLTDSVHHSRLLEQEIQLCSEDQAATVLHFPIWDTLPYDVFSPNPEIVSERMKFLADISTVKQNAVVIMPAQNLMQKVPNKDFIVGRSLNLKLGDQFDLHRWRALFEKNGYIHVNEVREAGEFVVRGGVLDLYPMGGHEAFRIELFDDEIESIRIFDTDTQLTINKTDKIQVMPANEFPFDDAARELFLSRFREWFDVDTRKNTLYQDIRKSIKFSGIEQYLPMFHREMADIFDYLPEATTFIHCNQTTPVLNTWEKQIHARYEERRHDLQRPILAPTKIYLSADDTLAQINQKQNIWVNQTANAEHDIHAIDTQLPHRFNQELHQSLPAFTDSQPGRLLIAADSLGRQELIADKLKGANKKFTTVSSINEFLDSDLNRAITIAPIENGVYLKKLDIQVLDEGCLFGKRVTRNQKVKKYKANPEDIINNLTDLHLDSPIVHIDHGVGRYRGLKTMDYEGEAEYLEVEYFGGDKLFVPVSSLHLVSRYSGASEENAPWHKLGSEVWEKAKQKAAKKVKDVAAELLSLYAKREAAGGQAMQVSADDFQQFCDGFPFDETEDQQNAINAVIKDMQAKTHMDRVVCGDVGFGKTEIALRAAFIAANEGKQVVLLVPTTLLAQQHYDNFVDRFAPFPVKVELLSRFVSSKNTKNILAACESGQADVVIGTHKLIQKGIKFKNLGLVIIDEEHRFGVKQKDQLKKLKADADFLTLTATPIPRTLNSALSGLRDLSIIATPPKARLAIKTQVVEWQNSIINEACTREIQRGGQVYFLHNEVQTIEQMAESIQKINPSARVRVAHGQMNEKELQEVMVDFYKQRFNILVCTTIIESGIDIPSANTIIINRADKLGLAQLHQLRGRVGRSHHKAFAYMIIPSWKAISKDAKKRLEAIESLEDLGAGFTLATHDMEIRGSGELLGEEQSGQIQSIGFSLYCDMLDRAVTALKNGEDIDVLDDPYDHIEIELNIPSLIPDDYMFDVYTRLTFYKRMNNFKDPSELDDLKVELVDRFGPLPEQTENLFHVLRIKHKAKSHNIKSIVMNEDYADIKFNQHSPEFYARLIQLVQKKPDTFRPLPNDGLRYSGEFMQASERIDAIHHLFDILQA
ncbi:transcription-repair coupling factor [Marinicella sp. S1101]|uniref:transcription-repair coupling factor n=1 Tax=Marinicella marina TaxID=2996016 RepID=UPI002260FD98|nr:transcription-repair coupling factor [Marinicella marina]MCX7553417.1 transcription-repair coupling factor [Marinicella marina]MDJ1140041.1 transcription-repair coupling factor [Marinicella marina]